MKIYSVHDMKAESYYMPVFQEGRVQAMRSLSSTVNAPKENESGIINLIAKYPLDFRLVELGEFDQRTGRMVLHENPKEVCLASDLIEKKPEEACAPSRG